MLRKVKHLIPAERINMDGFPVYQSLPTAHVDQVDPVLLIHHATVKPLFDRPARIQGVGPHPHRGFSPVTFVLQGEVHHRDSRGNSAVAVPGDIQWMHAGAGIIHSERPSERTIEEKLHQEFVQIWINSPSDKKMSIPSYQNIQSDAFPAHLSADRKIKTKVVSGTFDSVQGPANTQSELTILWTSHTQDGSITYDLPDEHNVCLYNIKGSIKISGYGPVNPKELVVFSGPGAIEFSSNSNGEFILLSGTPLNEKVAKQGPFVMNNETQILEAMRDYQMGKMGVLIEDEL